MPVVLYNSCLIAAFQHHYLRSRFLWRHVDKCLHRLTLTAQLKYHGDTAMTGLCISIRTRETFERNRGLQHANSAWNEPIGVGILCECVLSEREPCQESWQRTNRSARKLRSSFSTSLKSKTARLSQPLSVTWLTGFLQRIWLQARHTSLTLTLSAPLWFHVSFGAFLHHRGGEWRRSDAADLQDQPKVRLSAWVPSCDGPETPRWG